MIKQKLLLLSSIIVPSILNAQIYDYNYNKSNSHVGFQFDVNQNMGNSTVSKDGTKSTFAPFARLGVYGKRQITKQFYFKGGIMVGNGNFSYNYKQTFQTTSDTTYPHPAYGKRSINVPMIEPELAVGMLFPILNKKHQIDVRLGVSIPFYLSKYDNYYDTVDTKVTLQTGQKVDFYTLDRFQILNNANQWGMINANLFIGYKKIHYNDLSDRLGIGLTFGYTFYEKSSGIADYQSYNRTYNYQMTDNTHRLTYLSFGVRIEYDIF